MRGARWLTSLSALGALLARRGRSASAQTCPSRPRPCPSGSTTSSPPPRSIDGERDLHLQQPTQSRGQHHDMEEQGERDDQQPAADERAQSIG